jgi:hypothetical protein
LDEAESVGNSLDGSCYHQHSEREQELVLIYAPIAEEGNSEHYVQGAKGDQGTAASSNKRAKIFMFEFNYQI